MFSFIAVNTKNFFVQPAVGSPLYNSKLTFDGTKWSEFCLTLEGSNSTLLQTSNGTFTPTHKARDVAASNKIVIIVGPDDTHFFTGSLAGIRIYDRALTEDEEAALNTCEGDSTGTVEFTTSTFGGFGPIKNIAKFRAKKSSICGNEEKKKFLIVTQMCGRYEDMKDMCEKMGGRLPSRKLDYIEDIADGYFYTQCDNQTSLQYLVLESENYPNSCDALEVVILSNQKYAYKNTTVDCKKDLHFVDCILSQDYYTNRHTSSGNVKTLVPVSVRQRVAFSNDNGVIISYGTCKKSDNTCLYSLSLEDGVLYYEVQQQSSLILGRKRWYPVDEFSGMGHSHKDFLVTKCNESSYTCDSGACINVTSRCDGTIDCDDSSDEGIACKYLIPLPTTYWKNACPEKSPRVSMDTRDNAVNDVLMNNNEFQITLNTDVTWKDPRINFTMLLPGNKYQLPEENITELWKPRIYLLNGGYTNNLNIAKRTSLLESFYVKTNTSGANFVHDLREGERRAMKIKLIQRIVKYELASFN